MLGLHKLHFAKQLGTLVKPLLPRIQPFNLPNIQACVSCKNCKNDEESEIDDVEPEIDEPEIDGEKKVETRSKPKIIRHFDSGQKIIREIDDGEPEIDEPEVDGEKKVETRPQPKIIRQFDSGQKMICEIDDVEPEVDGEKEVEKIRKRSQPNNFRHFDSKQKMILMEAFVENAWPNLEMKTKLSEKIGIKVKGVASWFERTRFKNGVKRPTKTNVSSTFQLFSFLVLRIVFSNIMLQLNIKNATQI